MVKDRGTNLLDCLEGFTLELYFLILNSKEKKTPGSHSSSLIHRDQTINSSTLVWEGDTRMLDYFETLLTVLPKESYVE